MAYRAWREHPGLGLGTIRVASVYQHTTFLEEDVAEALGVDVRLGGDGLVPWREGSLPDGFRPQRKLNSSHVVLDGPGTALPTLLFPLTRLHADAIIDTSEARSPTGR